MSDRLDGVLPLLGVAGSVGHEIVVNVEAPVLGCEEPHVCHRLLHLVVTIVVDVKMINHKQFDNSPPNLLLCRTLVCSRRHAQQLHSGDLVVGT